jgi:mono/diheme cytochrome c family protein
MTRFFLSDAIRIRFSLPAIAFVLAFLLVPALAYKSWPQATQQTNDHPRSDANTALIYRGRYIVEDVAVCSQCHTPRDSAGDLERGQWLEGAPVWLVPARQQETGRFRRPESLVLPAAAMLT